MCLKRLKKKSSSLELKSKLSFIIFDNSVHVKTTFAQFHSTWILNKFIKEGKRERGKRRIGDHAGGEKRKGGACDWGGCMQWSEFTIIAPNA